MSKAKGYLTQCDSGGEMSYWMCKATARMKEPKAWRCSECEAKHGKREET